MSRSLPSISYPGPIRCPSRCLASSRSAKSTPSLSSPSSVRSCCTSLRSSARESSNSRRTPSDSAPPCPRIRSANALPTGEIARRNSVPPPKMNVMARMLSQSMASARLWQSLALTRLCQQPFREIQALLDLGQPSAEVLDLGDEALRPAEDGAVLRRLDGQPLLVGLGP